jgi:hypothetical protein
VIGNRSRSDLSDWYLVAARRSRSSASPVETWQHLNVPVGDFLALGTSGSGHQPNKSDRRRHAGRLGGSNQKTEILRWWRLSGRRRIGHVSLQICSLAPVRLGPPCRRPILIATKFLAFRGQDTSSGSGLKRRQTLRLTKFNFSTLIPIAEVDRRMRAKLVGIPI